MVISNGYICDDKHNVFENNNVSCFTAALYCSPPDHLPSERNQSGCDIRGNLKFETIDLETDFSKGPLWERHSVSLASTGCDRTEWQRVTINVSGMYFETRLNTLNSLPHTLLGDPEKRQKFWDEQRQEFFFDRHRPTFQAVLYYYQSGGRLKRPIEVPPDVFLDEILFYELDPALVDTFRPKEANWQEEEELEDNFGGWKRAVWDIFETPSSSWFAVVMAVVSILMTFVSVICICVETLPDFKHNSCFNVSTSALNYSMLGGIIAPSDRNASRNSYIPDRVKKMTLSSTSASPESYNLIPNYSDAFFLMESSYIGYFLIEFTLRLVSCPGKIKFVKNFLNMTDIVVIISFFVTVSITLSTGRCINNDNVFIVLRTFRIMRIFKIGKHSRGLCILGQTMYSSIRELTMFLMFLIFGVVIFSSGIYYAELHLKESSHFKSIPDTFWFCMVTITTVGYGEVFPVSIAGKLVGSLCIFSGVVAIALPVPVIVTNFNNFYYAATRRGHRPADMPVS